MIESVFCDGQCGRAGKKEQGPGLLALESRSESVRTIQWVLLGWFPEALSSQRVMCGQMDTHLRVQFPGMILIPEGQVGLSGSRRELGPSGHVGIEA